MLILKAVKNFSPKRFSLHPKSAVFLAIVFLLLVHQGGRSIGEEKAAATVLTADQVVERLSRMNSLRTEALLSYSSVREYHLVLDGIIHKSADMVVKMTYHWPDQKDFTIISESGSSIMRGRVLKEILKAEEESMKEENRRRTALNPENYEFSLAGVEGAPVPTAYILNATPRVKNRFLFKGKLWVDAKDFAVTRIECEPAKNPSWWTKKNDITYTYQKLGGFWLPAHTQSLTEVRIFGHTELNIVYKDYDLMDTRKLQGAAEVLNPAPAQADSAAPSSR
jgi:outer membrane lipoprotein-sorting protein